MTVKGDTGTENKDPLDVYCNSKRKLSSLEKYRSESVEIFNFESVFNHPISYGLHRTPNL